MEVERKFLVGELPPGFERARASRIRQGYLVLGGEGGEARVRQRDEMFTLTVKRGRGLSRGEAEIELSEPQFELLWPLTEGRRVEKTRYELDGGGGLTVELDIYGGELDGLRVAEVEFPDEPAAVGYEPPEWLGRDVTDEDAYKNRMLATDGLPREVSNGTGPDALSEREVEVLRLIAAGHTNTEIAARLYLSVRTVESHRSRIQQKTQCNTRAKLVAYVRDHRLA